jgi:hypothetical protein
MTLISELPVGEVDWEIQALDQTAGFLSGDPIGVAALWDTVSQRPAVAMHGHGDGQVASDPVTARTIRRHRSSNCGLLRKRGHPSGAPILKPCEFAVKPVRDRRATADRQGARHTYTRSRP